MPSNTSNSGTGANSVPQGALHPAKKDIYPNEKVLRPLKNSVPSVQNAVPLHFHSSQLTWLWLGLTAGLLVFFVLGFFAYSKFKIGRKPSLGKRNSRMTTIGNKVNLCESLYTLKTNFCNRKNAKSEQYRKYFESLRELQKDSEGLLNDAEKRAFKNCIDTCSENVKTTNKLATYGSQTLVKYGDKMGLAINALIDNLSTSQNSNAATRHASFQNLEQSGSHQNDSVKAGVSSQALTNELADKTKIKNLQLSLDKEERTVQEKQRKIQEINDKLASITNTANQNKLELEDAHKVLERTRKELDSWITENTTLEEKLNVQEAMCQRLNGLISPVNARTSLPQDAAPWSELDYYVQSLLGFAVLIDQGNNTEATSKLKDLQRVLFGPPPMNSLFDPEHPAPVDVFARIFYLQSDLRAKLREQNILVIMPAIGEKFDAQHHECAEADLVWDHDDPSKHNTIYSVRTIGFENRATGNILKKAIVRKQMFDGTMPPEKTAGNIAVDSAPSKVTVLETQEFPISGTVSEAKVTKQNLAPTAASLEPTPEIAPETVLAFADSLSVPMPTEVPVEVLMEAEMTPVMADSREDDTAVVDITLADDNTLTDPSEERKKWVAETIGDQE